MPGSFRKNTFALSLTHTDTLRLQSHRHTPPNVQRSTPTPKKKGRVLTACKPPLSPPKKKPSKSPLIQRKMGCVTQRLQSWWFWGILDCSQQRQLRLSLFTGEIFGELPPLTAISAPVKNLACCFVEFFLWSWYSARGAIDVFCLLKSVVVEGPDGNGTMKEIHQCLRLSLSACLEGIHPTRNWMGDPWPLGSDRATMAGKPLHPKGFFLAVFLWLVTL